MMDNATLARIRIVLVQPAGDRNIGAVARVMKNFGLHHLVLVDPQCDPQSTEAAIAAVHARDVLEAAAVVPALPEALAGCRQAIATTARAREQFPLQLPEAILPLALTAPTAIVFGPEDRGLSNEELKYAQHWLKIPTSEAYPSLNLAQAVAVCCYEVSRMAADASSLEAAASAPPAPLDSLEGYYQQLEALLLRIGFLYPHTAASRMQKLRRLCDRARPSVAEVAMLRGMLSQVEWALSQLPHTEVEHSVSSEASIGNNG